MDIWQIFKDWQAERAAQANATPGGTQPAPPPDGGTQPTPPPAPGQQPNPNAPDALKDKPLFGFGTAPPLTPQGGYGMYSYMNAPNPLLGMSNDAAAQARKQATQKMIMSLLGG